MGLHSKKNHVAEYKATQRATEKQSRTVHVYSNDQRKPGAVLTFGPTRTRYQVQPSGAMVRLLPA